MNWLKQENIAQTQSADYLDHTTFFSRVTFKLIFSTATYLRLFLTHLHCTHFMLYTASIVFLRQLKCPRVAKFWVNKHINGGYSSSHFQFNCRCSGSLQLRTVCANMAVQAQRVNSTVFMQWRSRAVKQKQYESTSRRLCSNLWERAEFYETANFDLWCWEVRKRLRNGKGVPRGVSTTQSYCGMGLAVAWLQIFWAGNQANMSRLPRKQDTLVIAAGVQAVQRPEKRKTGKQNIQRSPALWNFLWSRMARVNKKKTKQTI